MKSKRTAYPTLITGIGALLEQSRHAVVRPILHTLSAKSSAAIFQTASGRFPTMEILSTVSIESLEGLPIAQTVSAKCSARIFQTPSEKYATALRKFSAQDWCCSFVALVNQRDSKVSLVTSAATC